VAVTLTKLAAKEASVSLDKPFTLLLSVKRLEGSGVGNVSLSAADDDYTLDPDTAPVTIPDGQSQAVVPVKVTLSGPAVALPKVIGIDAEADEQHGTSVKVVS
jgi:hypothetical protein